MIVELGFFMLPPELEGKVNTAEDFLKPEVEFISGGTLATLEEKADYYEFRSDSENITKIILPIWEDGRKVSWWRKTQGGETWEPDDFVYLRPHEAGFLEVLIHGIFRW